jgi:hypothetical protein
MSTDVNNCGGCGHVCIGGGTCTAGVCQYPVTELASTPSGVIELVEDDTNLYWTSQSTTAPGVYYMPKAGGSPTPVATGTTPSGIAIQGGYIYWSDQGSMSGKTTSIMRTTIGTWTTITLGIWTNTDAYVSTTGLTQDKIATHILVTASNVYFLLGEYGSCYFIRSPSSGILSVPITGGTVSDVTLKTGSTYVGLGQPIRLATQPYNYTNPRVVYVSTCGAPTTNGYTAGTVDSIDLTSGTWIASVSNIKWTSISTYAVQNDWWSGGAAGGTWYSYLYNGSFLGTPNTASVIATNPYYNNDLVIVAKDSNSDGVYGEIQVGDTTNLGSANQTIHKMTTIATTQGAITTMTMDATNAYWVTPADTNGNQHIRFAAL